jgi:hypothetical protein
MDPGKSYYRKTGSQHRDLDRVPSRFSRGEQTVVLLPAWGDGADDEQGKHRERPLPMASLRSQILERTTKHPPTRRAQRLERKEAGQRRKEAGLGWKIELNESVIDKCCNDLCDNLCDCCCGICSEEAECAFNCFRFAKILTFIVGLYFSGLAKKLYGVHTCLHSATKENYFGSRHVYATGVLPSSKNLMSSSDDRLDFSTIADGTPQITSLLQPNKAQGGSSY